MTTTIAQSLAPTPPPFLALIAVEAVIQNTSGSDASALWRLSAQTSAGLRTSDWYADLAAQPGATLLPDDFSPSTLAAGAAEVFSVSFLAQFPAGVVTPVFEFQSSTPGAIQVVSPVLVRIQNGQFTAVANWPPPFTGDVLDPTNPNTYLPQPAPTNYAIPLLDRWS